MNSEFEENIRIIDDFDSFIENRFKKNASVLDIGFGTGKFLYRLMHCHNLTNLEGVELMEKREIEKKQSMLEQLLTQHRFENFLHGRFTRNERIKHFDYYEKYVEIELEKEPLSESDFDQQFCLKFNHKFNSKEYDERQFDFIIISRILHYETIKDPLLFIKQCVSLLKNNGFIYISFPMNSGRRKISKGSFERIIEITPNLERIDIKVFSEYGSDILIFKGQVRNIKQLRM